MAEERNASFSRIVNRYLLFKVQPPFATLWLHSARNADGQMQIRNGQLACESARYMNASGAGCLFIRLLQGQDVGPRQQSVVAEYARGFRDISGHCLRSSAWKVIAEPARETRWDQVRTDCVTNVMRGEHQTGASTDRSARALVAELDAVFQWYWGIRHNEGILSADCIDHTKQTAHM